MLILINISSFTSLIAHLCLIWCIANLMIVIQNFSFGIFTLLSLQLLCQPPFQSYLIQLCFSKCLRDGKSNLTNQRSALTHKKKPIIGLKDIQQKQLIAVKYLFIFNHSLKLVYFGRCLHGQSALFRNLVCLSCSFCSIIFITWVSMQSLHR